MPDTEFSKWFRAALEQHEWTQADFARRSGLSNNVVSQWARAKRQPTPESCRIIADTLYLSHDEVLHAAGIRPRNAALPEHIQRFHGMMNRMEWNPDRITAIAAVLEAWVEQDRKSHKRNS